jgi:hypothetical protein
MAQAHIKLKAMLQKIKNMKFFLNIKRSVLDMYKAGVNENTQNVSVFENITCDFKEQKLLDDLFQTSLQDILGGLDEPNFTPSNFKPVSNIRLSPAQTRQWQDWINSLPNNKERIVEYYKNGLANQDQTKPQCNGFVIVDKKKCKDELYTLNDGTEVMTSPTF